MTLVVYTKDACPACVQLKASLVLEGTSFVEVHLGRDMTIEDFKAKFPTVRSVPHMETIDET